MKVIGKFFPITSKQKNQKTEIVDSTYYSVMCSLCNEICHENCGVQELSSGSKQFRACDAFKHYDNCRKCKNRCSYRAHYHCKKSLKEIDMTIEEILQDVKTKFDQAMQGTNDKKKQK